MMHTKTIQSTIQMMTERFFPLASALQMEPGPWLAKSYETVAGRVTALAQLAETKAVTESPEVILRAAARLTEKINAIEGEIPQRQVDFRILWESGVAQNWGLPQASEELRLVFRSMDSQKRLEAITTAVKNPDDPASLLLLGSTLPFGIHPVVTGLPANQLVELRDAFIAKKLPAYSQTRETAGELFSNLETLIVFSRQIAREMGNENQLRAIEADNNARATAEARLASNN